MHQWDILYQWMVACFPATNHCIQGVIKDKDKQLELLQEQVKLLDRERNKLVADLHVAQAAVEEGKISHRRAIKASHDIAELRSLHEAEGKRRRQAEMEVERSKYMSTHDWSSHSIVLAKSEVQQ